jgi:hypothetical protein
MEPGSVESYQPRPPQPPTSTEQQFASGLAGGQELSVADIKATERVHGFITEANEFVSAQVATAGKSVEKYAQTEAASKLVFMDTGQETTARVAPVDTRVYQFGPMAVPTAFASAAPGGN